MAKKSSYCVNKDNLLEIRPSPRKPLLGIDGKFSLDKNNRLLYWLNEPLPWRREHGLPGKIIFKGSWRLDDNYDLELKLNETSTQREGDELTLKGEIVSCEPNALVFEIKSQDKQGFTHIRLLKLTGVWQADEFNRLSFKIKREPVDDLLTLEGAWQLNKSQQVIYTYEKADLKTKTKKNASLAFCGYWQINNRNRLSFILLGSSQSRFDFRAQIETPTIYPQKGVIKYRLGLGIKEDKSAEKVIALYGAWKFSRNLGLVFEVDYAKGGLKPIEFAADVTFQKNTLSFDLKTKAGEPLGITITFTHKFLKGLDARTFLRLKALEKESAIEAGIRVPF